nr:retrovirus-related Pol polyprotein from transposon TNT 1-94 [Tanacetum cinerariifolium]
MDVKSDFLNGKLKEEVYGKQPPGFESSEFPNHVCNLGKNIYRIKQAPRACGSASFKVAGKDGTNPELSSLKSTSIQTKPFYSASTIVHSTFASGHDASAAFIAEADPGKSNPHDSVSKQQGIVKGTNNFSFDHIIAG